MTRQRLNERILKGLMAVLGFGTLMQLFPSCEAILTTANPCGTVFGFCAPYEVYELFTEIPNYEDDPTCTIPYYGFDPDNPNPNGCSPVPVYPTPNGNRP